MKKSVTMYEARSRPNIAVLIDNECLKHVLRI